MYKHTHTHTHTHTLVQNTSDNEDVGRRSVAQILKSIKNKKNLILISVKN